MAVIFFKLDKPPSKVFALWFILGVWVFLAMITAIPSQVHKDPPYYGINSPWVGPSCDTSIFFNPEHHLQCWINPVYGYGYEIGLEYGILWLSMVVGLVAWGVSYLCLSGKIVVEYPNLAPAPGKWNVPSVSWTRQEKKVKGKGADGSRGQGQQEKNSPGPFALPRGYEPQAYGAPAVRIQTRDSVESQPRRANTQQALGEAAWQRLLFPIAYSEYDSALFV